MEKLRVFNDRNPFHINISHDLIQIANLTAEFLDGRQLSASLPVSNLSEDIFQACHHLLKSDYVDLCAIPFHFSIKRGFHMSFITPYLFDQRMVSAIKDEGIGKKGFGWRKVFKFASYMELEVWIAIVVTILVLAGMNIMYALFSRDRDQSIWEKCEYCLEKIIRIPLSQDCTLPMEEQRLSAKSLLLIWGLMSVVLVETFSGTIMAATMLSSGYNPPFRDLEGMAAQVRRGKVKTCRFANVHEKSSLDSASNSSQRSIWYITSSPASPSDCNAIIHRHIKHSTPSTTNKTLSKKPLSSTTTSNPPPLRKRPSTPYPKRTSAPATFAKPRSYSLSPRNNLPGQPRTSIPNLLSPLAKNAPNFWKSWNTPHLYSSQPGNSILFGSDLLTLTLLKEISTQKLSIIANPVVGDESDRFLITKCLQDSTNCSRFFSLSRCAKVLRRWCFWWSLV